MKLLLGGALLKYMLLLYPLLLAIRWCCLNILFLMHATQYIPYLHRSACSRIGSNKYDADLVPSTSTGLNTMVRFFSRESTSFAGLEECIKFIANLKFREDMQGRAPPLPHRPLSLDTTS